MEQEFLNRPLEKDENGLVRFCADAFQDVLLLHNLRHLKLDLEVIEGLSKHIPIHGPVPRHGKPTPWCRLLPSLRTENCREVMGLVVEALPEGLRDDLLLELRGTTRYEHHFRTRELSWIAFRGRYRHIGGGRWREVATEESSRSSVMRH